MWNEIEKRSIRAVLGTQTMVTERDFLNAYEHRGSGNILVLEDVSARGERILAVQQGETIWYLQSRYNAKGAAVQWAEQLQEGVGNNSVIIVFGFADGSYVRELLRYSEVVQIIVYEPCPEIFWQVCGRTEVAELLEQERVHLVIGGISESLLFAYLEVFVNYANFRLVEMCVLPNYDHLFGRFYRNLLDRRLFAVKQLIFSRNTEIVYGMEYVHNVMGLVKDVIEQYSIVQLKDVVKIKGFCGLPAVLVSAGPSLDKNIDQLREIQDNVFIMAVDTALNTVLTHGIIPDMTITVDGHKPLTLFENERINDIPMAVSIGSNEKVIRQSRAKRFYEIREDEYLGILYDKIEKAVQGLPTGGSVANNALSLLVLMGFETVIFMGQDLAYPGGLQHAFDAYHIEQKLVDGVNYYEIEDVYGEKVVTEENMELYLKWFESYIALMPGIRFVDATEGGAKIHGTEICTMSQMVEEFSEQTYDKKQIFEGLEPYLNKEEQQEIKKIIADIPKRLDEVQRRIKGGLRIYDKLDQLNRKSNGKSETLRKLLGEVAELNTFMDEEPVLALVRYYTIEVGYEVEGTVLCYDEKAPMYDQIKGLIDNGRMLLRGYLEGIKEFRKDADNFLQDFTRE